MGAEGQRYVGRHLDSSSVAIEEEKCSQASFSISCTKYKRFTSFSDCGPARNLHSQRKPRHGRGSRFSPCRKSPYPSMKWAWRKIGSGLALHSRCRYSNTARPLRDIRLTDSSPSCGVSAVLPREKSTVRNWPDACNTRKRNENDRTT